MSVPAPQEQPHVLQCMDLWSGNQSVENIAESPGVEMYLFSEPYRGESRGGDVHYVSLCAGGIVTRVMLADVAGHGSAVAETSQSLRSLMRRHMNAKSQTGLVRGLNREFSQIARAGRFATAIVATYLSHRRRLRISNAGHPRPLRYSKADGSWTFLEEIPKTAANFPLGVDETSHYSQFDLPVAAGDLLILYTDAVTEAEGTDGLLGEAGLWRIALALPTSGARQAGQALRQSLGEFTGHRAAGDDLTIMVLSFTDRRRIPGLRERFRGYAKVLGLRAV